MRITRAVSLLRSLTGLLLVIERGGVLEIATDLGALTARTWVIDLDGAAVIYYDAEPEVVRALQSGRPLEFGRRGVVRDLIPRTTVVDRMPAGELARIFELMTAKYGDRNRATDVYYTMLGRSRDRVAVVISLTN